VGTGFKILVTLHLFCVIAGFGALAYNGLYLSLGRRQGFGLGRLLEVNRLVSALAELAVYGVFVFGVAAVAASNSQIKFSQGWVTASFVLYLVDLGVLHGWIRGQQRRFAALVGDIEAAAATAVPGATGPAAAQVALLDGLERRINAGWGVFNIVFFVVVVLMVFKPGG
jgi:hypothetical protein